MIILLCWGQPHTLNPFHPHNHILTIFSVCLFVTDKRTSKFKIVGYNTLKTFDNVQICSICLSLPLQRPFIARHPWVTLQKHDFQYVPLQPEEQRGWCCLTNRFSMVKVIHITYLSFGLFLDFASHEIVYSFCFMWQCKKSNFQKEQFSISPLRRRLCNRNNTYWESTDHRSPFAHFWYCTCTGPSC